MKCRLFIVVLTCLFGLSCSSNSHLSNGTISGPYEFVVTSNVTGGTTLVEANLSGNGNQSSATGPTQAQILTFQSKTWYLNGVCSGSNPGRNSVSASVGGSNVALTFDDGGNAVPAQGVLTGTTVTGNYSLTGSSCAALQGQTQYPAGSDSGGFVGNPVANLSGSFSGTLSLPDGVDDVSFTLKENSDHSLGVDAVFTGSVDNETVTFTGTAVGNVMFVTGPVNGTMLNLFGYFDRAGSYTSMPNSLLVFNYDTSASAGLLIGQ